MTRLEARWKMICREEGLAGAGRLGYAQSALLELSIGIAFTVVKAKPDNQGHREGYDFRKCRQHRRRHPQQYVTIRVRKTLRSERSPPLATTAANLGP
jgi:hypothetical protein